GFRAVIRQADACTGFPENVVRHFLIDQVVFHHQHIQLPKEALIVADGRLLTGSLAGRRMAAKRQTETKSSAFPLRTADFYASALQRQQPVADRKAQTRTAIFSRDIRTRLGKAGEDMRKVLRADADPFVL